MSSSRQSLESPPPSSCSATLRARSGRPAAGLVLAAAGLVLCICAAALCTALCGDPGLGLCAIGIIGHKLVLGLAALRTAFARAVYRLAAPRLAALRTAVAPVASRVAQAASRVAPRRLSDTVFFLLLYLTLSFRTADGATAADGLAEIAEDTLRRGLQGAQMAGGRPPRAVEAELCTIVDVFSKLTGIKTNLDCQAGCAGGTGACPADWYPSAADECSAACGEIFEPFVSAPASTPALTSHYTPSRPWWMKARSHCASLEIWRERRIEGFMHDTSEESFLTSSCACRHRLCAVGPMRRDADDRGYGRYG